MGISTNIELQPITFTSFMQQLAGKQVKTCGIFPNIGHATHICRTIQILIWNKQML